jgi:epoxyqueuosine reductase
MHVTSGLPSRIKEFAGEAGFDLCGIAPAGEFHEAASFPAWIAAERHGEMRYLESRDEAGELKRGSLARVAPWARNVIVCAINYNTAQPYSTQASDPSRGWISRYAWSEEDYHDAVLRRLREVEARLIEFASADQTAGGEAPDQNREIIAAINRCVTEDHTSSKRDSGSDYASYQSDTARPLFRSYVDTGPIVERVYAKYAGVGWIGKNTCIINQKLGSWLFLGVILTSLELEADLPAPDRCGSCTRCIDACPTEAIVAPGELDARLCISYLTIEKRGEISETLRGRMGRHVFGCDICQDVCPWNRKAPVATAAEFLPREGLVNPALDWLAEMQSEEFRTVFRGSPIRRTKLAGLRRNAVIAMGNSGQGKFVRTLERLADDADPIVAEHARWALSRLGRDHGAEAPIK